MNLWPWEVASIAPDPVSTAICVFKKDKDRQELVMLML